MSEEKIEEQVAAYFAKELSFTFSEVKNVLEFFESMREFSHHLSENHYYSEGINKRVMGINLDIHSLSLELPQLQLEGYGYYDVVEVALLSAKTPQLDKGKFEDFRKHLATAKKKAVDLNTVLQKLVGEIRLEYSGKV